MFTSTQLTKTRMAPTKVATDTFLIHDHAGEGHAAVLVPLNSMVIRSAEPVVVDTEMAEGAVGDLHAAARSSAQSGRRRHPGDTW